MNATRATRRERQPTRRRALVLASFAVCLTACSSRAFTQGAVHPQVRSHIEQTLTSATWETGYSGSTVWHWTTYRFLPNHRAEWRHGHEFPNTPRAAGFSAPARVGTWRVTRAGAVEQIYGETMMRETFASRVAIAPISRGDDDPTAPPTRSWMPHGFLTVAAQPGTFRRESAARRPGQEPGHALISELAFGSPIPQLGDPCEVLVHVRAQTFEGDAVTGEGAVDVYLPCHVDRSTTPWLIRIGDTPNGTHPLRRWKRPHWSSRLMEFIEHAVPRALAFDDKVPEALIDARGVPALREVTKGT